MNDIYIIKNESLHVLLILNFFFFLYYYCKLRFKAQYQIITIKFPATMWTGLGLGLGWCHWVMWSWTWLKGKGDVGPTFILTTGTPLLTQETPKKNSASFDKYQWKKKTFQSRLPTIFLCLQVDLSDSSKWNDLLFVNQMIILLWRWSNFAAIVDTWSTCIFLYV